MDEQQTSNSDSVNVLRSNLRENRKLERFEMRHESSDAFRVGVGVIKEIITDLDNITEKDVIGMASRIKRKKGANEQDLMRLSHAFLQNAENITTFSKITGALNVIVKELSGNDSARQLVSAECLCNFSLGNDICCEKLALNAGSYLIMFLESTNQRLAITSAWTLSNILLSAKGESSSALISQGLISKLISISKSKSSDKELVGECLKCLYAVVSNHVDCLRSEDKTILSSIIADFMNVDCPLSIKITYHSLFLVNFKLIREDYQKISEKCLTFLSNYIKSRSSMSSLDEKLSVALVLRIIGNLIALESNVEFSLNDFIHILTMRNESFSNIISAIMKIDSVYTNELLWVAGNVYRTSDNDVLSYLNQSDDIVNTLIMIK